jgi:hypothetical protein
LHGRVAEWQRRQCKGDAGRKVIPCEAVSHRQEAIPYWYEAIGRRRPAEVLPKPKLQSHALQLTGHHNWSPRRNLRVAESVLHRKRGHRARREPA